MEDQIKTQFEQAQNGFQTLFDNSRKMADPALRTSLATIESMNKMAQDQLSLANHCMDITRQQLEALRSNQDWTEMMQDTNASSHFYSAIMEYSEALRQNAQQTSETLLDIGREAASSTAHMCSQATENTTQAAQKAAKTADKASKEESGKGAGKNA